MICAGVSRLFSFRGPWAWCSAGFFIVVGIGLLKLYQWARIATIAVVSLEFGLYGTVVFSHLYHLSGVLFLTAFLKCFLYGYVMLYMWTSSVRLVFVRPVRDIKADDLITPRNANV